MDKAELKLLLKEMFENGELRIDLDSEDHIFVNNIKKVFPVVNIDNEQVFTGSFELIQSVL